MPARSRPAPRPSAVSRPGPATPQVAAPEHAPDAVAPGGADGDAGGDPGAHRAGRLSRLLHRRDDEDDAGPFFPPETAAVPAPARSRPGPGAAAADVPAAPAIPSVAGSTGALQPADPDASSGSAGQDSAAPPAVAAGTRPRPRTRPQPNARPPSAPSPGEPHAAETEPPAGTANTEDAAADPDVAASGEPGSAGRRDAASTSSGRVDISRFVEATAPEAAAPAAPKKPRRGLRERLRSSRLSRRLTRWVIVVVVVVAAALTMRAYVVSPFYIPSESMEPALHGCAGCSDDHVLVDKFSYRFHQPHPGDIVVFDRPKNFPAPDKQLVKRVVAVSGDEVALRNGLVYVNGARLTENYLNKACGSHPSNPETGTSHWTVPDNDLFVMGDNRCDSADSRTFGPIPVSSVIGRVFLIIWPLSRFGTP